MRVGNRAGAESGRVTLHHIGNFLSDERLQLKTGDRRMSIARGGGGDYGVTRLESPLSSGIKTISMTARVVAC